MAEVVTPLTLPVLRFTDAEGAPLAGAKLYAFEAGTSTPKPLYTDVDGVTAHPHPAVADAAGQLVVYVINGEPYKLDLFDANDVHQSGWPIDDYLGTTNTTATFTPRVDGASVAGTGTYVIRSGSIQQVGRLVSFSIYIEMSNHTGLGNLVVRGLPITGSDVAVTCVFFRTGGVTFDGPIVAALSGAVPEIQLFTNVLSNGTINPVNLESPITDADVVTMILSGTYRSAA